MKINIFKEVIVGAIFEIEQLNKNFNIDTKSLFENVEDCELDFLYDLCNNKILLFYFKGAYKNIKSPIDIVKVVLHNKLSSFCCTHHLPTSNYLMELEKLK